MTPRCLLTLLTVSALAGCVPPDQAGQQVGRSLYGASVSTGNAISAAGDRTGAALQSAGDSIRNTFNPPPTNLLPPPDLPPPYVAPGFTGAAPQDGYANGPVSGGYLGTPVQAAPLSQPGTALGDYAAPPRATPPNPSLGY